MDIQAVLRCILPLIADKKKFGQGDGWPPSPPRSCLPLFSHTPLELGYSDCLLDTRMFGLSITQMSSHEFATSQFKLREYTWSRLLNVEFSTIILFLPNHNHLQHEHEQLTSNAAGDATSTYAPDVTRHPARPASAFSTLPSHLSQTASTTMCWYSCMYLSSIAVGAVDNPSPPRPPQFPWMLYVTSADGQRGWYGHASTISDKGDAPPPLFYLRQCSFWPIHRALTQHPFWYELRMSPWLTIANILK